MASIAHQRLKASDVGGVVFQKRFKGQEVSTNVAGPQHRRHEAIDLRHIVIPLETQAPLYLFQTTVVPEPPKDKAEIKMDWRELKGGKLRLEERQIEKCSIE